MHLLSIGAKDVVLAASKVGVHLAGQQCILRDVCVARVLVQRQDQQPRYANDDAQRGEVGWDFEDAGIAPERQQRGWTVSNESSSRLLHTHISVPCRPPLNGPAKHRGVTWLCPLHPELLVQGRRIGAKTRPWTITHLSRRACRQATTCLTLCSCAPPWPRIPSSTRPACAPTSSACRWPPGYCCLPWLGFGLRQYRCHGSESLGGSSRLRWT